MSNELKACTYKESVAIIKDVGAFPPKEALARNDPYLCAEIKRLREELASRPTEPKTLPVSVYNNGSVNIIKGLDGAVWGDFLLICDEVEK